MLNPSRFAVARIAVLFIVPLLVTLLILDRLMPVLYRHLPNDYSRSGLILKTLRTEPPPRVVLFGNSILMNAIDARVLADSLGLPPGAAVNLGSTGQSPFESMLYYSLVPPGVRTVVQFVFVKELVEEPLAPPAAVCRNLYLYGLRPDTSTYHLLGGTMPACFDRPGFMTRWDGRGLLRDALDLQVRKILRKDLLLSHTETDIYYPVSYTRHVEPEKLPMLLKQQNPPVPLDSFSVHPEVKVMLNRAAAFFASRGVEYIVVVDPLHPGLDNYRPAFRAGLSRTGEMLGYSRVLDLSAALPAEYFVDQIHPDAEGARLLTALLARYMAGSP